MPESSDHQVLVRRIVYYVSKNFSQLYSLWSLDDLPKPLGKEKPPSIFGYRPDLYGRDVPRTTTIIGEAKTPQDIEKEHTRKQLSAYLSHLARTEGGVLIISVNWKNVAALRQVLRGVDFDEFVHLHVVKIIILDEVRELIVLWP